MSQTSGQVSENALHGGYGSSQALMSYLSAAPTITERISNNLPKKDRQKKLEEKITSLDVKIRGKSSGSS